MKALRVLLLLCLIGMTASCVEPLDYDAMESNALKLTLRFFIPHTERGETKTDGTSANAERENTLYDLQVWAFDHDYAPDTTALAYGRVTNIQHATGWTDPNTYEMTLFFPYYLTTRSSLKVDFYVLGNGASINLGDYSHALRSQIDSLGFGIGAAGDPDPFGASSPVLSLESGKGLPISGYFDKNGEGYDISDLKDSTNWKGPLDTAIIPVMKLSRAVSKLNFIVSRPQGLNAIIQKIELNTGQIPDSTFVFPHHSTICRTATHYGGSATLGSDSTPIMNNIGEMDDPASLRDKSVAVMLDSVSNGRASLVETYFRESDIKTLNGIIYYKVDNGTIQTKSFSLNDREGEPFSFRRNHSWTVYAYFQGNSIRIQTSPWNTWQVVVDPTYIE